MVEKNDSESDRHKEVKFSQRRTPWSYHRYYILRNRDMKL